MDSEPTSHGEPSAIVVWTTLARKDRGFIVVNRGCEFCKKAYELPVDEQSFHLWNKGEFIQNAFPYATASDREMLISGSHPECWDKAFGGEE